MSYPENDTMLKMAAETARDRQKEAERILFMVFQCINFAKREGTLPDVFDEQLCEGIATFFKGNHS